LGASLPESIAKLFPTWALKVDMRRGITASILKKLDSGDAVDRADVDFVANVLGEQEGIWLRRKEIAMRAVRIRAEEARFALPPKPSDAAGPVPRNTTADEWVRRFLDDAGAVSDGVLQEVYARVLAGESAKPGSCSLRTLRALRYMDRRTADNFGTLLSSVVGYEFLPKLLKKTVSFDIMRDLNDAGLLDFRDNVAKLLPGAGPFGWLCGPCVVEVAFEQPNEANRPNLHCYLLNPAGRELAAVAGVEPNADFAKEFSQSLLDLPGGPRVQIADRPHATWNGHRSELSWTQVERSVQDGA
jgi:hypothetical protein